MATESFTCLRRNRPKTIITVKQLTMRLRYVYNVGVQSSQDENCQVTVRKLKCQVMPLSFKHIIFSVHRAALLEASAYT